MASDWATVSARKKTATVPQRVTRPNVFSEAVPREVKQPLYKATRAAMCAQNAQVKWGAASNRQNTPAVPNPSKLDQETEQLRHNRISREMGILIQKGRQVKGWSQKDLALKINEKPQVIAEYEGGRGVKNNLVIAKIENALGMKVRQK